jgi:hypothetical protein
MNMFRYTFLLALLIAFTCTSYIHAQKSVRDRTKRLISQLEQSKLHKKGPVGVQLDTYFEIKLVPTPEGDIRDFSGSYGTTSVPGQSHLEIEVAADGTATGKGFDLISFEYEPEYYTLKDARVTDSLLTGTRVFKDHSEPFEAVFASGTRREGTSRKDAKVTHTATVIGYIKKIRNEGWTMRMFLAKQK